MNRMMLHGSLAALLAAGASQATATPDEDRQAVAALDTEYQAAVERNDAGTMARILHDDMMLVLGDGRTATREDLLRLARERTIAYEHQAEIERTQTVRLFGPDTATVTALLWISGTRDGARFERRLWFSDTYVRTATGWRYAFGQASLPLPAE